MRVLVADDDPIMRRLLQINLQALGHETICVDDGLSALDRLKQDEGLEIVISDWMMPGLNGIELCREIRALPRANYVHVVLLTARHDRTDYLTAMEAGADDFLGKPLDTTMLTARLKVAERVLGLQADLRRNNRKLADACAQLQADLDAAARLQQSLLPAPFQRIGGVAFATALFPSASVSGDVYNFFALEDGSIAMYVVDVAGHGARAALMSVTLSRVLTAETFQDSIGHPRRPDAIAGELNERFQMALPNHDYFTMIGAVLSPEGRLTYCQAGHPHPIVVPADAKTPPYPIGNGGFPVALIDFAAFESHDIQLARGDRVIFFSDGITESADPAGELYGEERLGAFLGGQRDVPLERMPCNIKSDLQRWQNSEEFKDDVSILAFEILEEDDTP